MESSDFKEFVARLAEAVDGEIFDDGEALGMDLRLDEGRRQRLYIGLATDALDQTLLVFYTAVGEAKDVDPMAALELNATIPYGSVAATDGKIVLRRTERLAALDPESVATCVRLLALNADVIEEELYGGADRF